MSFKREDPAPRELRAPWTCCAFKNVPPKLVIRKKTNWCNLKWNFFFFFLLLFFSFQQQVSVYCSAVHCASVGEQERSAVQGHTLQQMSQQKEKFLLSWSYWSPYSDLKGLWFYSSGLVPLSLWNSTKCRKHPGTGVGTALLGVPYIPAKDGGSWLCVDLLLPHSFAWTFTCIPIFVPAAPLTLALPLIWGPQKSTGHKQARFWDNFFWSFVLQAAGPHHKEPLFLSQPHFIFS